MTKTKMTAQDFNYGLEKTQSPDNKLSPTYLLRKICQNVKQDIPILIRVIYFVWIQRSVIFQ